MIEVHKLNKIYNQHKSNSCHALKDVSFSLPNKGLVFILGKSGSGKSTLLNLLGAMDDITSGDIIVEGESLAKASIKQLDYYRTNYISIIYQNFCLFESETVLQNISLSTFISKQKSTPEDINHVLDVVDLSNKKNTLVKELSGGQKQRVAIARALLKHPKILLADEPTGNLDSRTTKSIFNSLIKISKKILVVVITHDVASAEMYGDRIIEIGDGKIIGDRISNPDYNPEEDPNTIYLDENYNISKARLKEINTALEIDNIRISKREAKFLPIVEQPKEENQESGFGGKEKTRKIRPAFSIGKTFFKSNVKSFIVSLLVITFIFSISVSAQLFTAFNQASAITQTARERELPNFYLTKIYQDSHSNDELNVVTTQSRVVDDDISFLKENGYSGNIYPVYNTCLCVNNAHVLSYNLEKRYNPGYSDNYAAIYSTSGVGTCVCDLSFLNKTFGGSTQTMEVLAGSLVDLDKSVNLIVTDYFADSIIETAKYYNYDYGLISDNPNDPYCNLFNKDIKSRYRIGAVIKTNYKEKYKTTLRLLEQIHETSSSAEAEELSKKIKASDEYAALMDHAQTTLNVTYSINPNFVSDYKDYIPFAFDTYTRFCDEHGNILSNLSDSQYNYHYINSDLKDGEMIIGVNLYNTLFHTSLVGPNDPNFEKKNVIVDYFDRYSKGKGNSNATLKTTIVALCDDDYSYYLSKKDFITAKNNDFTKVGLVFDNVESACSVATKASTRGFTIQSITFTSIRNLSTIVNVFSEIFIYVFIVLLIIIMFIELAYYFKIINRNKYRMGIYRSLGVSTETLTIATFGNSLVFNCVILFTSLGFSIGSAYLVNYLLTKSFVSFLNMGFVNHISLVTFSFGTFFILFAIIVAISVLAIVLPLISLRKIKPNVMMNSAEDK